MVRPRALVLRAAGTNCDLETEFACARVGFEVERVHVRRLIERPEAVVGVALLVIPGGFTYGDDLGAGRILANELRWYLGDRIRSHVEQGGLILGICNGFQVLVKAGILPDPRAEGPPQVTLTFNDSGRFEARWVRLRAASRRCLFWPEGGEIELPVAHGEGKFVASSEAVLDQLEREEQLVFRYAGPDDGPVLYPWNPNGSMRNVAAICDPSGRVLGLMPHPERFMDLIQHPSWVRQARDRPPDGWRLFEYARRAASALA